MRVELHPEARAEGRAAALWLPIRFRDRALRHVLADVPRQNFVDESLVTHPASACFLAKLLEHSRIHSNGDQSARFISEGRPTDAGHRLQLLRRRVSCIGNFGRDVLTKTGTFDLDLSTMILRLE